MDFFLLLLFLDLLLNRTLNRLWIFIPQNPFTHALFLGIQWAGYVSMLALYVYSFLLIGSWGKRGVPLGVLALVLTALDLSKDYLGFGVKALFLLPLIFSVFFKHRVAIAYSLYYLAEGIIKLTKPLYLAQLEWAWALLPLVGGWRFRKIAVILAALLLVLIAASPYYTGMIFVFGMGLSQVFLLPAALFLSLSSKSKYPLYSLLVGPSVQLSVHYITLAVATGYVNSGKRQG